MVALIENMNMNTILYESTVTLLKRQRGTYWVRLHLRIC